MKKSYLVLAATTFTLGMAACLPGSGDPTVDRNKDGIADGETGSVRGIDEVIAYAPSSPTISVFGAFHDGYTGEPIANVAFTVTTAKGVVFSETANDIGGFQVDGVSPGALVIEATVDGYGAVRALMVPAAPTGNTDNFVRYLGKIYLLPADGTWSFTAVTQDGRPLANATVYVDVPSVISDRRINDPVSQSGGFFGGGTDLANGVQPQGFRTVTATTNAAGVASVTGVPDVKKLFQHFDGTGNWFMAQAWVASQDLDADGTMDVGGSLGSWTLEAFARANMKVALPPLTTAVDASALALVATGNVITDTQSGYSITRSLATTESLVLIFNQPIDVSTIAMSAINDWANSRNFNLLDNSTPIVNGQGFPTPKADYDSKPVSGTPTLVPSVDPSGTVVTLTPTIPWSPGAEYVLIGQVASARHSGQPSNFYVFSNRGATGFRTVPAGPIAVSKVFVERNDGGDNYGTIVIMLSEVIRGYRDGSAAFVLVCSEEDFGVNGSISTAGNGSTSLDQGECPPADYAIKGTDIASSGNLNTGGLRRAYLRPGSPSLTRGAGRYFQIAPQAINAALSTRSDAKLRVYLNPLVDGAPYEGGLGNTDHYNSDARGNAFPSGTILPADFSIVGTSTTPVQLELPTNNAPQFN